MPAPDGGKQEFLGPEPHLLVQALRKPLSEIQPEPHGSERNCFFPWSVEGTVALPTLHVPQKVTTALHGWSPDSFQLHPYAAGSPPPRGALLSFPKGDEESWLAALAHCPLLPCRPEYLRTEGPYLEAWHS